MTLYVEVIVDIDHQAVDQTYDYSVPEDLDVAVGQRVIVPFGPRKITGYIISIKTETSLKNTRSIIAIKDIEPLLSEELLQLTKHLAYKQASPRLAFFDAMIPNALKLSYETLFIKKTDTLDPLLKPYFKSNDEVSMKALTAPQSVIKAALKEGALEKRIKMKQRGSIKTEDIVTLLKNDTLKGKSQKAVMDTLVANQGALDKKTLLESTGASHSVINRLKTLKLIDVTPIHTYREIKALYQLKDETVALTEEQEKAYLTVKKHYDQPETFLLHGVTSSGKTELYIQWAKDKIEQGKEVIVLLPEIALTPKITARFKSVFKDQVAMYHSGLSLGEQYDQWRKMKQKEVKLVIGTRSAIFAPFENIGLIILDEEHSDSYYQSDHPSYHAKEVASLRSEYHQAPLILGSATPSVESYYKAKQKHYKLLTLTKRALNAQKPKIQLVDMKKAFLEGNKSLFSKALQTAMKKRIEANEQTLLLINRRGHANFILCRSCGKTVLCDECFIPMTYHKHDHTLKCHYCHTQKAVPELCPHCSSPHIRYMGIGSERVEEAVKKILPEARVMRMDRDTTQEKNAHEKKLFEFEKNGDVLVGTQMIAKGLDLERVTLVGVLSADMSLSIPTYDAKEETYALLTQIAGRAGRRQKQGEVIIQAYESDHDVLQMIKAGDYEAFYESEISMREKALYPPFMPITSISIEHKNQQKSYKNAIKFAKLLKGKMQDCNLIGPTKARFFYRNNRYRYQFMVKCVDQGRLMHAIHAIKPDLDEIMLVIDHHPKLF